MPRPKPGLLIDSHIPESPWDGEAKCKNMLDLFFSDEPDEIAKAKKICYTCSIRGDCLERAIVFHETEGVWGGMTYPERRSLVRRRRRNAQNDR